MAWPSYTQTVLADTPLLYWRLNDVVATAADTSGNSHTGAYNGGYTQTQVSTIATDSTSKATLLNGSTGYIRDSPAYNLAFPINATRTFEVWFNRTDSSADMALFSTTGGGTMLRLPSASNNVTYFADTGNASTTWTAASPGNGVGVHLVFTQVDSGAANQQLWINGVDKGNVGATTRQIAYSGLVVGARGTGSEFLKGSVTEFAIYDHALTTARIQTHYYAGINDLRTAFKGQALNRSYGY